jgi:aromatic-L-amino-acid decarboxylase
MSSTSPTPSNPLEPDEATLRAWFEQAIELSLEHLRTLPDQKVCALTEAAETVAGLSSAMPEEPGDASTILQQWFHEYVPPSFNTASPGYLAYIPGGGLVSAALADLISNITNRYTGLYASAPVLVQLEIHVLRWLLDLFGFPAQARGVLTSGGSLANWIATVCARDRQLGELFQDGVMYCSDHVHHSMLKAAHLAGFPKKQVRMVASDEVGRLQVSAVQNAIRRDRARGLRPALLVASAGTVNTGCIDDLQGLADVAQQESLWLHIDGAYGAFFQFTERGRKKLSGIERADSLTVDPHKGLFLPYGTGCLLVREGEDLRRPHGSQAAYMPPLQDPLQAQDFCEYSPELSRDFRGLRIWLSFQLFGAAAFRATLDEKLDLAACAADRLAQSPHLQVLSPPSLSLFAFRLAIPGKEGDRRTQFLLQRVLARQRVFLSATTVRERFYLRLCILNFRTHRDRVEECLDQLLAESEPLMTTL